MTHAPQCQAATFLDTDDKRIDVREQKTDNRNQINEFRIGNLHHKIRIHINGHLDWVSSENFRIFRHKLINKLMQRCGS